MQLLKRFLTSALLASVPLFAGATTPLLTLIGDQAPFVLSFHDIPDLRKNWAVSPWAKTWNDPQVMKFFAPMRAEMKWDEIDEKLKADTGYTLNELMAFATGDAVIAIPTADIDFEFVKHSDEFPLLVAIELGENAPKVEKLLADSREKNPKTIHETEEYAGVTIHTEANPAREPAPENAVPEDEEAGAAAPKKSPGLQTFSWAITDGVWLIGFSKPTLLAAVDALKKGGAENPYASSAAYLAAQQKSGARAHVRFALNFGVIIPRLQEYIVRQAATNEAPNPFLSPAAFIPALGLDAWNQLSFAVNFSERDTVMTGGFTFSEARGLLKMFSYGEGPVALPSFVPAKALTGQSSKISLKNVYNGLEEMIGAYNPAVLGMGQMYLEQFNKQLGIDLKRDFFGSFGDDLIAVMAPRPGASTTEAASIANLDTLYAFSLANAQTFQTALDALFKAGGPQAERLITKREYLGYTINTYAQPVVAEGQPQQSFSFAVAKNYLLFSMGSAGILESSLQNMAKGGASFWDRADVKKAFAQIPANAGSFSYQNTSAIIGGLFTMFADFGEKAAAAPAVVEEGEPMPTDKTYKMKSPIDPSAKPDIATISKYWGDAVGYLTRDRDGYSFKSTLQHK